jgi:peptidoglycan/LPS O-acetylase OafA/YrhL
MVSNDVKINENYYKRCNSDENHRFSSSIYYPFVNLINYIICFDILLITIAFILSFGNILSKDPYMSKNYQIPLHCIIYFLLGFLLSYMCFKKVQKHCQFYRHFIIVCSIFLLIFTFFFVQISYNDHHLNLFIRLILSAGTSIFFVTIYSLHVYNENKTRVD